MSSAYDLSNLPKHLRTEGQGGNSCFPQQIIFSYLTANKCLNENPKTQGIIFDKSS